MIRKACLIALLALMLAPVLASAYPTEAGKPVDTLTAANIVGTRVLANDTVWVLSGRVQVESGEVLIIEPGTIIKGDDGTLTDAAVLLVSRGGKIYAEGTPENPIIFTSIFDNVDDPNDIEFGINGRGLWGGVIVCGYAQLNTTATTGEIEGIPEGAGGTYGGGATPNDDDNSGIMRYVSIRHGGVSIAANNEINGLTLGAVGRGTVIEHIEVYHNLDDGFEWFGGTVNTKYLVAAFCGDDSFDYDQGYRGKGQFWFTIHESTDGDRGGEWDGGTVPEDGLPYAIPTIYNATFIGGGVGAPNTNRIGIGMFDNAGGKIYNSIFTEFSGGALSLEDLASGQDCRSRLDAGDLDFQDNIWYAFANPVQNPTSGTSTISQQFVWDALFAPAGKENVNVNPQINAITRSVTGTLDPRPNAAGPAGSTNNVPADSWFDAVNFKGAFDPSATPWVAGWTALDQYGVLATFDGPVACDCITDDGKPEKLVDNTSITNFTVWNKDTVYVLTERVFVQDGEELLIEPGTIVKGDDGSLTDAAVLAVSRGGRIYAIGGSDCPVIMTSIFDDVDDANDIEFGINGRGLWGGLIICGYAQLNTTATTGEIEGIPEGTGGTYGGGATPNDDDNSGVINYLSIRHGGVSIAANNEINGLTLGAVGRGTVIDHVEVYHNLDDGVEWFGGTVNCTHLVVAFCGDDSFDYDQGYRGKGQFWFTIHEGTDGDRGGEWDGGTVPEDGLPYAIPTIYNATFIGGGVGAPNTNRLAIGMFDNAGGKIHNSIFTEFSGGALSLEDLASGQDCRSRLDAGDLDFQNNIWYSFANPVRDPSTGTSAVSQQFLWDALFAPASGKNNVSVDPLLNNVNRAQKDSLDPRPDPSGPAGTATPSADPFFTAAAYKGAFDPDAASMADTWIAGWTFLSCGGIVGDVEGPVSCCVLRGDLNSDTKVIVSDLTFLVNFLFKGGAAPTCFEHGDLNGDNKIIVSDLTYMVNFLFKGGVAPVACP